MDYTRPPTEEPQGFSKRGDPRRTTPLRWQQTFKYKYRDADNDRINLLFTLAWEARAAASLSIRDEQHLLPTRNTEGSKCEIYV